MLPLTPRRWTTAVVSLALVAGCSAGNPAPDTTSDPVRAVVLPFLTQAPFQIAADEGYFTDRDLEVEFVRLPRIQDVNTALARGEVDAVSGMLTVALVNSVLDGAKVRMVATLGHLPADRCPYHGWVTRRELVDSGRIDDPGAFRQLRIDVDLVLPDAYFMSRAVAAAGSSVDDLRIVTVPPTAAAESLLNGDIDITGLPQPLLDLALRDEEIVLWRGSNGIVPDYPISLLMYGPTLLEERPEVGQRFAEAMLEAAAQFRQGKTPRNVDILQRFTGLDRDQVAATCWPTPPEDPRIDYPPLREYQDWTVARGLTDRVLSEEEIVDHRFVDAARAAAPGGGVVPG
ncbi:MAG: ABC transporter substrate-binding protein, partial [Acidobacteriota bacterium]